MISETIYHLGYSRILVNIERKTDVPDYGFFSWRARLSKRSFEDPIEPGSIYNLKIIAAMEFSE